MNFPTERTTRTGRWGGWAVKLHLSPSFKCANTHISLIKCQKAAYENQCSIVFREKARQLIQKGKGVPWGWLFDKPTVNEIYSQIRSKPPLRQWNNRAVGRADAGLTAWCDVMNMILALHNILSAFLCISLHSYCSSPSLPVDFLPAF